MSSLQSHIAKWANCTRCTKLCESRSRVVPGHGNSQANLFLLGEAPGRNEDKGGKPFIGRAGDLLTKIINALDLKRDDLWISNSCLCRPHNNRTPSGKEILNCKERLRDELKIIQPRVVVAMGNTPLRSLTGLTGINKNRGWVVSELHQAVYCTYHPAALLYDKTKKPNAWTDWQKIRNKLNERA